MKRLTCLIVLLSYLVLCGCALNELGKCENITCHGNLDSYNFNNKAHVYVISGVVTASCRSFTYVASGRYDVNDQRATEIITLSTGETISSVVSISVDPWLNPLVPGDSATFSSSSSSEILGLLNAAGATPEQAFPLSKHYFQYGMSEAELNQLRAEAEKPYLEDIRRFCSRADCMKLGPPKINFPSKDNIIFKSNIDKVPIVLFTPCRFSDYKLKYYEVEKMILNPLGEWQGQGSWITPMKPTAGIFNNSSYSVSLAACIFNAKYRIRARHRISCMGTGSYTSDEWSEWRYFYMGMPKIKVSEKIVPSNFPDFIIKRFEGKTLLPGEESPGGKPVKGKSFLFRWQVRNIGKQRAATLKLDIQCTAKDNAPCPSGVSGQHSMHFRSGGGNSATLSLVVPAPAGKAEYLFKATVDPDNSILEWSETNNTQVAAFVSSDPKLQSTEFVKQVKFLKITKEGEWKVVSRTLEGQIAAKSTAPKLEAPPSKPVTARKGAPQTASLMRIDLRSPQAGKGYYFGGKVPVRWSKALIQNYPNIWLQLCYPNGQAAARAYTTSNTGSYEWLVKEKRAGSYRIKIWTPDKKYGAMSGIFQIKRTAFKKAAKTRMDDTKKRSKKGSQKRQ
jgi:hypothetical protein